MTDREDTTSSTDPLDPDLYFVVGRQVRCRSMRKGSEYTINEGAALAVVHRYSSTRAVLRFTVTQPKHHKTLPVELVEFEGERCWVQKGFGGDMFGAEYLAESARVTLVICEGEKTCLSIRKVAGKTTAVITWAGGHSVAGKVKELINEALGTHVERVILCPDHDAGGYQAMYSLHKHSTALKKHPNVKYALASPQAEPGWDLADVEADEWRLAYFKPERLVDEIPEATWESLEERQPQWNGRRLLQWAINLEEQDIRKDLVAQAIASGELESNALTGVAQAPIYLWPQMSGNGKPKCTVANLQLLLTEQRWVVSYNVIAKEIDVYRVPLDHVNDDDWWQHAIKVNDGTVQVEHCYHHIVDALEEYGMPTGRAMSLLDLIAARNHSNPVVEWLGEGTWDGRSRLEDLYATLNIEADDDTHVFNKTLLTKWLMQTYAAGTRLKGVRAAGALVFTGREGKGKTQWLRRLVQGNEHLFKEGVHLDPGNKDSVMESTSCWLAELGELDGMFKRSDLAALKAFITKGIDEYRAPYERKSGRHPRRTSFAGTVNQSEFLTEPGAHRRFWTIIITGAIDWDHDVDMTQVWLEVKQRLEDGELFYLDEPELRELAERNEQKHVQRTPYDELLELYFDDTVKDASRRWMTTTEVMTHVHGGRLPTGLRAAQTQCGQALMRRYGEGNKKTMKGVTKWFVPRPHKVMTGETDITL